MKTICGVYLKQIYKTFKCNLSGRLKRVKSVWMHSTCNHSECNLALFDSLFLSVLFPRICEENKLWDYFIVSPHTHPCSYIRRHKKHHTSPSLRLEGCQATRRNVCLAASLRPFVALANRHVRTHLGPFNHLCCAVRVLPQRWMRLLGSVICVYLSKWRCQKEKSKRRTETLLNSRWQHGVSKLTSWTDVAVGNWTPYWDRVSVCLLWSLVFLELNFFVPANFCVSANGPKSTITWSTVCLIGLLQSWVICDCRWVVMDRKKAKQTEVPRCAASSFRMCRILWKHWVPIRCAVTVSQKTWLQQI